METKDNQMMEEEKWTLVIVPKTGLFRLDLRELWRYRDLLAMYIHRDIVTFINKQYWARCGLCCSRCSRF